MNHHVFLQLYLLMITNSMGTLQLHRTMKNPTVSGKRSRDISFLQLYHFLHGPWNGGAA